MCFGNDYNVFEDDSDFEHKEFDTMTLIIVFSDKEEYSNVDQIVLVGRGMINYMIDFGCLNILFFIID